MASHKTDVLLQAIEAQTATINATISELVREGLRVEIDLIECASLARPMHKIINVAVYEKLA